MHEHIVHGVGVAGAVWHGQQTEGWGGKDYLKKRPVRRDVHHTTQLSKEKEKNATIPKAVIDMQVVEKQHEENRQ